MINRTFFITAMIIITVAWLIMFIDNANKQAPNTTNILINKRLPLGISKISDHSPVHVNTTHQLGHFNITKQLKREIVNSNIVDRLVLDSPNAILTTYRNGNQNNAINILEQLVRKSNWQNISAVNCLYEIYTELDMLNQAELLMRQALALNQDNDDIALKLTNILSLNNKGNEAEQLLTNLLKHHPTSIASLEEYHNVLRNNGNERNYFESMEQLIDHYPNNSDLYVQLADSYKNYGSSEDAELVFRDGIRNNPDDYDLKLAFADAIANTNSQEAIELYKEYAQNVPNSSYAYLQLGNLYYASENFAEGDSYYQRAININPGYADEINRQISQY